MKKLIYLAGAMEYYQKNESNQSKAWRDTAKIFFKNYSETFRCIDPMDYYSFSGDRNASDIEIMRFDLRKVKEADIILVDLNHIRQSIGTSDEILFSYLLGKPIIGFLDDNISEKELINMIHGWKYSQIDRIETGERALLKSCEYIKDFYG